MKSKTRIMIKLSRLIENEAYLLTSPLEQKMTLFFCTLAFIVLAVMDYRQQFFGNLGVVFSQIQVILSVFMTIRVKKWGYFTALCLNLLLVVSSFLNELSQPAMNIRPMFIVPISTSLIISIIYLFMINFHRKIDEISVSNEKLADVNDELQILNEELKITHEELEEQNELLKSYNSIIKESEEKLSRLAYTDMLTELPNRKTIINRLDELIHSQEDPDKTFAIAFIDLDDFKKVNDTRGHDVGDVLLKTVAKRLKAVMHPDDLLGRLGGDEFAMIIKRPLANKRIYTYIETLRQALIEDLIIDGQPLPVHASFGLSRYPEDGLTSSELLKSADQAMYQAKSKKKNGIEFFKKNNADIIPTKLDYGSYFNKGLENDEFYLVFQPQLMADSNQLRGFEVLVRWKSAELGEIKPNIFLPVCQKNGLMPLFGQWILKEACEKFIVFQNRYDYPLVMSVNLSEDELLEPGFLPMVKMILETTGVSPQSLEFEISEKVLLAISLRIGPVLEALTSMGILISVDDFGQRMTYLMQLLPLSIQNLKMDAAFIKGLDQEESDDLPVESLIAIGHRLKRNVFAKGVETDSQLKQLQSKNIDGVQGYFCGKPMDQKSFEDFLNRH